MNAKLLILIVIIVVVVAAGVYFYRAKAPGETGEEAAPSAAGEVSSSDTVSVIDQELEVTETENLDKEFADIEVELNAALSE